MYLQSHSIIDVLVPATPSTHKDTECSEDLNHTFVHQQLIVPENDQIPSTYIANTIPSVTIQVDQNTVSTREDKMGARESMIVENADDVEKVASHNNHGKIMSGISFLIHILQ